MIRLFKNLNGSGLASQAEILPQTTIDSLQNFMGTLKPIGWISSRHFQEKIREIIRSKGLTQVEAARILGLSQPKLSGILRGQFRGVSERKLIDCLTSLGRDVEIVVKDAPRRRDGGKLTVVFT